MSARSRLHVAEVQSSTICSYHSKLKRSITNDRPKQATLHNSPPSKFLQTGVPGSVSNKSPYNSSNEAIISTAHHQSAYRQSAHRKQRQTPSSHDLMNGSTEARPTNNVSLFPEGSQFSRDRPRDTCISRDSRDENLIKDSLQSGNYFTYEQVDAIVS